MVSHAELPESSRRASSVASRTRSHSHSRSHSHHRNRSHYGGAQHVPQNEFPFFAQTGDVEFLLSCDGQEKRYLLHRLILAQFSGFFEAGTSENWSRTQAMQNIQAPDSRDHQSLSIIGEETSSSVSAPQIAPEHITQPGRRRWRYELDWEHVGEDEEPMLVQKVCQYHSKILVLR